MTMIIIFIRIIMMLKCYVNQYCQYSNVKAAIHLIMPPAPAQIFQDFFPPGVKKSSGTQFNV